MYQSPRVAPVANQAPNQQPKKSNAMIFWIVFCIVFIILVLLAVLILLVVFLSGSLHLRLENKVDLYPDDHSMGDVILYEGNDGTDYMGIIDGDSMNLENAHVVRIQSWKIISTNFYK